MGLHICTSTIEHKLWDYIHGPQLMCTSNVAKHHDIIQCTKALRLHTSTNVQNLCGNIPGHQQLYTYFGVIYHDITNVHKLWTDIP